MRGIVGSGRALRNIALEPMRRVQSRGLKRVGFAGMSKEEHKDHEGHKGHKGKPEGDNKKKTLFRRFPIAGFRLSLCSLGSS
jgi:hypothetical protein